MKKDKQIVLPGEQIAVMEEFMPGEGTHEVNGTIVASTMGTVEKDMKNRTVRVRNINPPAKLKVGDMVYGMVTDIRSPIVTVEIFKLKGTTRGVAGDNIASLHISNISSGYTTDIRREMRIGDIVIAEVIQVAPSLQLSTAKQDLGVVRAQCARCRTLLIKRHKDLYCKACMQSESRKLAKYYDRPYPGEADE